MTFETELDSQPIESLPDDQFDSLVAQIGPDALADADSVGAVLEIVRGSLARWANHPPPLREVLELHRTATIALARFRMIAGVAAVMETTGWLH